MHCLNDTEIQLLADGEAADEIRRHAATCASCGARVRERRALMAQMGETLNPPKIPLVRLACSFIPRVVPDELGAGEIPTVL